MLAHRLRAPDGVRALSPARDPRTRPADGAPGEGGVTVLRRLRGLARAAPPRRGSGALSRAGWSSFLAVRGAAGGVLERGAALHRRRLPDTTFVGVTGSAGKTTTKDLIGAVLAARFDGVASRGGSNDLLGVVRTLARTRRRHRFCVQELGTWGPGSLARSIRLLRPHVGVVTVVGKEHWSAFRSLEAVAREKATLIDALGVSGTAVLNHDDPRVRAMAERCAGAVVTVGMSAEADVRAVAVRSAWPERLSFTVVAGGRTVPVRTALVGEHWLPAVLAAIAVGSVLGVTIDEAGAAVETLEPQPARMSVYERADGVVFLRDDFKAPAWSLPRSLDVLARARARRRIVVRGTLSDKYGRADKRYRQAGRLALAAADHVVLVGPRARMARPVARGADESRTTVCADVARVRRFLDAFLEPGDVVLLKGNRKLDRLRALLPPAEARRRGHDPVAVRRGERR
jgi:UDP-N-acetylmuramyl pentapeptide synthase